MKRIHCIVCTALTAVILFILSGCERVPGPQGSEGLDGITGPGGPSGLGKMGLYVVITATDLVASSAWSAEAPVINIYTNVTKNTTVHRVADRLVPMTNWPDGYYWSNRFSPAKAAGDTLEYSVTYEGHTWSNTLYFRDLPVSVSVNGTPYASNDSVVLTAASNDIYNVVLTSPQTGYLVHIWSTNADFDQDYLLATNETTFRLTDAGTNDLLYFDIYGGHKAISEPAANNADFFLYERFDRGKYPFILRLTD